LYGSPESRERRGHQLDPDISALGRRSDGPVEE